MPNRARTELKESTMPTTHAEALEAARAAHPDFAAYGPAERVAAVREAAAGHPFPIGTRVQGDARGRAYTGTVTSTGYDHRNGRWSAGVATDEPFTTPAGRTLSALLFTSEDRSDWTIEKL